MRSLAILLLVLSTTAAHADTAAVQTPLPSPVPTMLCNPPVTPDPTFQDASYATKWPHIALAEAKRLMKLKSTVFIDGRSKLEWDQSHLPGALPMPLGEFDKYYAQYEKRLRNAKIVVAYCHGKGCHLSDGLAQRLVDKGLHDVAVYWGGWPEWHDNRMPMVDKNGKRVPYPALAPTPKAK